jgi:hypothetical protein
MSVQLMLAGLKFVIVDHFNQHGFAFGFADQQLDLFLLFLLHTAATEEFAGIIKFDVTQHPSILCRQ